MKKTYYLTLILLLSLFFSTCDYQFSEDYYEDIKIEDFKFTFKFTNFKDKDVFRENKRVFFEFNTGNEKAKLLAINFYRNGFIFFTSNTSSGNFLINIDNLNDGKHDLKVEFILETGTGSLVDKLGQERYVGELKFEFNVNKSIDIIEISNIEQKEGSIYVNWKKPEHLERYSSINLIIKERFRKTIIPLLNKDSLIHKGFYRDSLSLTFNMQYQIEANNKYNKVSSEEIDFFVKDTIVGISHKYIDQNNFEIKWNKHPLYNNFENYLFETENTKFKLSTTGGEMIINSPVYFGGYRTYTFKKERQTYIPFNQTFIGDIPYGISYNNNKYENLIFDEKGGYLYATNMDRTKYPYKIGIFKLNPDDFSVINKSEIISYYSDEPTLIFNNNSDLILDDRIFSYVVDKNNLMILEKFDAGVYNKDKLAVKSFYRNGLIFIRYLNDFKNIYVYNAITKELLYFFETETSTVFSSYDYFTIDRKLYKIENKEVKLLHTLSDLEPRFYKLEHVKNSNKLILQVGGYYVDSRDCIIYDLENNSTSKIKGSEGTTFLNFDYKTNNAIFTKIYSHNYNEKTLYFVNIGTKEIKTYQVAMSNRSKYRFFNKNLMILDFGYYLKNPLNL